MKSHVHGFCSFGLYFTVDDGLWSGIEANLHAVRAIWPQSAGWTEDSGVEEEEEEDDDPQVNATLRRVRADGLLAPNVDPGAAEYDRYSRYEAETGFGSALFDARNGFNELNRYLMLWNVEPGKSVCIQPLPALGSLHG